MVAFLAGDVTEDDRRVEAVSDNETGVAVNDELYVLRAGEADVFGGVVVGMDEREERAGDTDVPPLLRLLVLLVVLVVDVALVLVFVFLAPFLCDGDADVDDDDDLRVGVSLAVVVAVVVAGFVGDAFEGRRGEEDAIGGVRGDNLLGERFCHEDISGLVILGDE